MNKGIAATKEAGVTNEASKTGVLRGGNSGCEMADGYVGSCKRKAQLRYLGIQDEVVDSTTIMFKKGELAEREVFITLLKAGSPDVNLLYENAAMVNWLTKAGGQVTGTPDIIIADKDNKPTYGIECKTVNTVWKANSAHLMAHPDTDYLCQAGHYMSKLDIPYSLVYISTVWWHVSLLGKWAPKNIKDKKAHPDVEFKNDAPFRIVPFIREYKLSWDGQGRLCYTTDGLPPQTTTITKAGIDAYYNSVAKHIKNNELAPGPAMVNDVHLKHPHKKDGYKSCDYCPFSEVCSSNQTDKLDEFSVLAKDIINSNVKK